MDNPAAWHPDPAGKHDHRWWDGQRWTEHVADAGVASVDPLPPAPGTTDAGPAEASAFGAGAGTEEPGASDPATAEPSAADLGADPAAGSDSGGPAVTDHAGDLGVGEPSTADPAARELGAAPTAGAAPSSEQPVWGQQPAGDAAQRPWGAGAEPGPGAQQPGAQQPWGGAPAGAAPWTEQQPSWGPGGAAAPASNGMAVGALVTGIVALPLLVFVGVGGLIGGIVAVILGIVALRRVKRGTGSGRGLAIGGIVLGAISIVMGVLIFVFFLGIFGELADCLEETGGDSEECQRRLTEQLLGS
ncbi:DUF4190 domain-containing protein [Nitriliruptor alkaliphilus]|uniref:DUF4190 domain-containing protein n=1 Tax=Nitriliruptor alkaliphilus TaxID=427918 RepID=UPI00146FD971|nr:DUF4190 domain-containing protein [Nitriliruptor alkaliphilus]